MNTKIDSELYKKSIVNSLAGLLGNLATGLFYPLELLKLRLQGNLYLKVLSNHNSIHKKYK